MQTLHHPCDEISGLTFSPDGDVLAGIGDCGFFWWTRSRGWEPTCLPECGVECVAFHPDGRALAYVMPAVRQGPDIGGEIRLYSLTPACRVEPEVLRVASDGDPPAVPRFRQVAFTPDGLMLVSNGSDSRGMFYFPVAVVEHWSLAPNADGWRVTDPAPARTVAPNGARSSATPPSCWWGRGARGSARSTRPRPHNFGCRTFHERGSSLRRRAGS